jgi:hypothetical protein
VVLSRFHPCHDITLCFSDFHLQKVSVCLLWLRVYPITQILIEYFSRGFKVTRFTPLNSSRYLHSSVKVVFVLDNTESLKIVVAWASTTVRVGGIPNLTPIIAVKWLALCCVHKGHGIKLGRGISLPQIPIHYRLIFLSFSALDLSPSPPCGSTALVGLSFFIVEVSSISH